VLISSPIGLEPDLSGIVANLRDGFELIRDLPGLQRRQHEVVHAGPVNPGVSLAAETVDGVHSCPFRPHFPFRRLSQRPLMNDARWHMFTSHGFRIGSIRETIHEMESGCL